VCCVGRNQNSDSFLRRNWSVGGSTSLWDYHFHYCHQPGKKSLDILSLVCLWIWPSVQKMGLWFWDQVASRKENQTPLLCCQRVPLPPAQASWRITDPNTWSLKETFHALKEWRWWVLREVNCCSRSQCLFFLCLKKWFSLPQDQLVSLMLPQLKFRKSTRVTAPEETLQIVLLLWKSSGKSQTNSFRLRSSHASKLCLHCTKMKSI